MNDERIDLARTTLGVLFIGGLTLASFWILRPFLPAFIWAVMIVVATWPLMRRLDARFGGRRGPAVAVMTVAMLLIFVVPIAVAIGLIADYSDDAAAWVSGLASRPLPQPPAWLAGLPLVGERAATAWAELAASGMPEVTARIEPYTRDLTRWLVAEAGTVGLVLVQCLLIVILSAVLYAGGEAWGGWMIAFGRRLAGDRGQDSVILAGQAIRGVALGVVVTALIQASLGGIGVAIAGVPFPGLLTAIMLVLCIAQIGPILVLLAGTAWLFANGEQGWGTFMLVWSLAVGLMDNFLRPVLIKMGADLPLILIFAGVIGGLLSFGLIGLFVGPVVLAVTYTLVDNWVQERRLAAKGPSP
ncbi:MAG: AI-2E family transporter YdiK [Chromatiales bacterium]|nr:AI-2E family transporter YdiK [Chromatiales bacterium]